MATNHKAEARLSPSDLQHLPVVQAALAIRHSERDSEPPAPAGLRLVPGVPEVERTARPLRPVAHWVLMPTGGGRARLEMVWATPDPLPPASPC